ncbi:MAG: hypothetical protein RLZZ112_745, partial [Verrucomicrobiota bacterium]
MRNPFRILCSGEGVSHLGVSHGAKFLALIAATLISGTTGWGQTPYDMSGGNKTWNFSDIANWANNFASGVDAANWGSVGIIGSGSSVTTGTRTTKSSATFVTGTSGGLQKGTQALLFLSTGTSTTAPEAVAVDLFLNFTGRNAGTLSFDWAAIDNPTGTRPTSLRVFWSTDGVTFTEITSAQVLDKESSAAPASGSVSAVALPTAFNNSATARLRFYNHIGSNTGSTNRDKMQIDNVAVTSTAAATAPTGVSNGSVGSFSASGATITGNSITTDGGSAITERGVVYGTSANPTTANSKVTASGTIGSFDVSLTGLNAGTTYYTRAYAINGVGTTYASSDVTVLTVPGTAAMPTSASVSSSGFTVSWSATTGATSYRIDVDDNSDFGSPLGSYNNLIVNGT